jgi:hypothetical protein
LVNLVAVNFHSEETEEFFVSISAREGVVSRIVLILNAKIAVLPPLVDPAEGVATRADCTVGHHIVPMHLQVRALVLGVFRHHNQVVGPIASAGRASEFGDEQRFFSEAGVSVEQLTEAFVHSATIRVDAPHVQIAHVAALDGFANGNEIIVDNSSGSQLVGRVPLDARTDAVNPLPELAIGSGDLVVLFVSDDESHDSGVISVSFGENSDNVALNLSSFRVLGLLRIIDLIPLAIRKSFELVAGCGWLGIERTQVTPWSTDGVGNQDVYWIHTVIPQLVEERKVISKQVNDNYNFAF